MAVLGFRRPQFSEEAAWLPEWLQNSQTTVFEKLTNESEIKALESGEREASEEGHYNVCHLYLSGSDKSVSSLRSTASVLHLNLHLSSDGTLQYTQGPSLSNYPPEAALESSSHSEKVSIPVEVRQNTKEFNSTGTLGSGSLHAKLTTRESPGLTLISTLSKGKYVKKIQNRHHNYGNFDHVVELSIAASETLIIRELLENCQTSPEVDSPALLDISLKVKQARARLLGVEEDLLLNDQLDESCEDLSDLDDSLMVDAFEDVGLFASSSDYCNAGPATVSHVNESPQHDLEASCNLGNLKVTNPERDSNCASKENSVENWDMDRKVQFTNGKYPISNYDTRGLEFLGSGQANVKFQSTELHAGFNMPKLYSSTQPQLGAKSPGPVDHNVHDFQFQLKHPPSDRSNSCWLGACTRKDDCPGLTLDTRKCTAKAFAVETSYLSESFDVPDKSSYVDRRESKHLTSLQACTSASVMPSANLVEGELLISPEIAKYSSSLSVDPLCSYVPCSYLSETPQSVHNGYIFQKCGKYLNVNEPLKSEPDCLNTTSEQIVKGQCTMKMNEKDPDHEVQNQLDSLNNNSVVLLSRPEMWTVPISDEHLLFQSIIEKQSCYSKTKRNTDITCGNDVTNAPYIKSTSSAISSSKGLPSIESIADDVAECTNNAVGGARFLPFLPEQRLSAFNMKGRNLPQVSEGLCSDKTLDCTASQRVLDDFTLRKTSHAPQTGVAPDIQVLQRKRVHFKEDTFELAQSEWIHFKKRKTGSKLVSNLKSKLLLTSNLDPERETSSQKVKKKLTNYHPCNRDKLIFRGLEFLLTGLPKKRLKEIEQLIIRYGGIVLFDIPPRSSKEKICMDSEFQKLPVVLCSKKVETTKFLYGCAVKACILKVNWLLDSVSARSVLQPEKYMIFANGSHAMLRSPHADKLVFEGVGVMFHGKHRFCSRFSHIFKHGGGHVLKALQRLVQSCERNKLTVQVIVAEDRSTVSRHLKHCATERNIPIVSVTWIISSLLSGQLLPITENDSHVPKSIRKTSSEMLQLSSCLSQEI